MPIAYLIFQAYFRLSKRFDASKRNVLIELSQSYRHYWVEVHPEDVGENKDFKLQNCKKQFEFKHLKEATVNWWPYLIFQACFMTSKRRSSSAKTIVVSELKSTLRNSSHLSASSRHVLKTWKSSERGVVYRRTRTVLPEYSWDYKIFTPFVFHEELFCFWRPARRLACRRSPCP